MASATKKKLKKRKTNPNKVNQYTAPDPRQALFLSFYLDPQSDTYSNVLQSGLRAGFAEEYSKNLKNQMPAWLSEKLEEVNHDRMLQKAERNLNEILDLNPNVQAMGAFGPLFQGKGKNKKPIMVINPKLLGIKAKTTEFVAERIGKKVYGQAKVGVAVQINVQQDKESYA